MTSPIPEVEEGQLELESYLTMITAADNPLRYSALRTIIDEEEISFTELAGAIDMENDQSKLKYHLNQLSEVGLIQNYRRPQPTEEGYYSYYMSTPYGEIVSYGLEDLLVELVRKEGRVENRHSELVTRDDEFMEMMDELFPDDMETSEPQTESIDEEEIIQTIDTLQEEVEAKFEDAKNQLLAAGSGYRSA